ncbi:11018_t:CDS:2, partial [Scutellospora calospora]
MNQSNNDLIQKCLEEVHIKFYEYSHFKDIKFIVEGGYGKVHRATLKDHDITLKLHRSVDIHSNIIRLLGATKNDYMLVLEYADGGNLKSYLKDKFKYLSWKDKINFALQITDAVKCLHINDIVHRDLHSDNILVHQRYCWQHDPNNRPDIRQVFSDLENLIINYSQAFIEKQDNNQNLAHEIDQI